MIARWLRIEKRSAAEDMKHLAFICLNDPVLMRKWNLDGTEDYESELIGQIAEDYASKAKGGRDGYSVSWSIQQTIPDDEYIKLAKYYKNKLKSIKKQLKKHVETNNFFESMQEGMLFNQSIFKV